MNERNIAASVRTRLLNHAKASKQDFNLVLTYYAIERLLYRVTPHDSLDAIQIHTTSHHYE